MRITQFILFVVLFFSTLTAKAQVYPTIESECANGSPGDTVCIDFNVKDFNNIVSIESAITWNTAVLQYVGVGTSFGLQDMSASNFSYNANLKTLFLSWSTTLFSGISVPNNTDIFTLCFKVVGAVGTSTKIEMKGNSNKPFPEITNANGDDIGPNSTFITCTTNVTPPNLKPLTLNIDKKKVAPSGRVCVPVTCENFKDLKILIYKITWDTAVVRLDSISKMLPVLSNAIQVANNIGSFNFNWSGGPLTLPDSTVLFQLCFKAVGKPGTTSAVDIALSPTPTATNSVSNGQNVGINRKNGSVTINSTIAFPLETWITNANAKSDEEVCLDVKVKNFKGIVSFQYTIQWDPLALQFIKLAGLNLIGLDNSAFSLNNTNIDGNLTLGWYQPNPVTLADSTTIFQICFKPVGNTGKFPIEFTSNPTKIDVHSFDGGDDNIGLISKPGYITVSSALTVVDTTLINPTCKEKLGGKITVDISGGTKPYKYLWSSNAYNATSASVSTLAKGLFTVTITDSAAKPNKTVLTVELPGDFAIPKAKAKSTGTISCTNTVVTLDGTGSDIGNNITYEWITSDGVIKNGKNTLTAEIIAAGTYAIMVTNTINGCSDTSQVLTLQTPDVPIAYGGPEQFILCGTVLKPIVLDGTGSSKGANFTYLWTTVDGFIVKDATTQTPTVTKAGSYQLEVTNTTNGCKGYGSVKVVGAPDTPIAFISAKDTLTCNKKTVLLNALGSSVGVGFTYKWSATKGGHILNSGFSPTVDSAGVYILEIKNLAGCVSVDSVRIYAFQSDVVANAGTTKILGCIGNSVQLDGSKSTQGSDVVYSWTTQTGIIILGSNTAMPTVSKAGSYRLTLKNKLSGCSAISNVVVVEDKTIPIAVAAKDVAINCYQNIATLDGKLSSQGSRFKYNWITLFGIIESGNNTLSPTVSEAGKYFLVVRDTLNGCVAVDSVTVKEDKKSPVLTLTGETELNCKTKKIVISVSPATPANYAFSWTTKNGQTITTPKNDSITVTKAGLYNVVVLNKDSGCKDSVSTSITQVEVVLAKAGTDLVECDNTTLLSANQPTGTTGLWTSTTLGAVIASPNLLSSDASGLKLGQNKFIWTLSSALCPSYSADTVVVLVESKPTATDDVVQLNFSNDFVNFNVTNNDKLAGISTWNIKPISKPAFGNLDTTNILGNLRFKSAAGFGGELKFDYKVCSKTCPVFCDSANVTLLIKNDNINKSLELPNVITPNGDGSNDALIFDVLSFDPEKYKDNELVIFNRWGDIVFSAKPYTNNWTGGNSNGQALPEGTYYYVLRLNIGEGEIVKSDVTIVR